MEDTACSNYEKLEGVGKIYICDGKIIHCCKIQVGNLNAIRQFCKQWSLFVKYNHHYRMNVAKIRQLLDII